MQLKKVTGITGITGMVPVQTTETITAGRTEMAETITEMETAPVRTAATITATAKEMGTITVEATAVIKKARSWEAQ